ncbi:MAG: protein kinase [Aestuariibacter sp.]
MQKVLAEDSVLDSSDSKPLEVSIAAASSKGIKTVNEDYAAYQFSGNSHELENKGVCAALADGVSSAEAGREASHYCVHTFLEEYFRTPDTWSVKQAGQKTLSAINLHLFKRSHAFTQEEKGFLCTFTAVVIKSRIAHFFHAGDSRLYLVRDNEVRQLSRDHTANLGGGKQILARAVGMDNNLQIDYGKQDLKEGDVFFLTTDGVHEFIQDKDFIQFSNQSNDGNTVCEHMLKTALQNGSDDNVSCLMIKVIHLPNESIDDFSNKLTRLPFPPELSPGMSIDGYRIEKELFASSRSQIYLVTDTDNGQQLVMKTPSQNFIDDIGYIDRFIQEEWIGKRINNPHVVKIIKQTRKRQFLYYLMEYVPGVSLEKWMAANPLPKPKTAIDIVKQIANALQAFHQSETIHQDLKPGNIIVDKQQKVTVIDFGSVFVAGIAEIFKPLEHQGVLGTATYSDPHYLLGKNTSIQGDIYALATISYELFTGNLPYGEEIDSCQSEFDFDKLRYQPAMEFNPIIPIWFDRTLQKGVSLDLAQRYTNLDEFIHDLSHPNPDFLRDDPRLENSRSLIFWQFLSAFWIITLIIVIVLFSSDA